MGCPIKTIDELLNSLDAGKKDWCLVLLLDRDNLTPAGLKMLNLLSDFDEDSGDAFDFYLPGYSEAPVGRGEDRRLYYGDKLSSVPIVMIDRLGELYFSRRDFRAFYKMLERLTPGDWRYNAECELVLFRRKYGRTREKQYDSAGKMMNIVEFCSYNLDDIVRNGNQPNQFVRRLCNTLERGAQDWMTVKNGTDSVFRELIMPPSDGTLLTQAQHNMQNIAHSYITETLGEREYIFISYSTKDYDFACNVRKALEESKIKCWMAPLNIPCGTNYAHMIQEAVEKCGMFLLLLSENSMNSIWVQKEALFAMGQLQREGRIYVAWCRHPSPILNGFGYGLVDVQIDDQMFNSAENIHNVITTFYGRGLPNGNTSDSAGWINAMKSDPTLLDKTAFVENCPWNRFGGEDWIEVLSINTNLESRIPFDSLSAADSSKLISKFPHFRERCDWKRISLDFPWGAVKKNPMLLSHFPVGTAGAAAWLKLLRTGLVDFEVDWGRINELFSAEDWVRLLVARPEYSDKCRKWDELTGEQWTFLLSRRPEIAGECDKADGWAKLTKDDLAHIAHHAPVLKDRCHNAKKDCAANFNNKRNLKNEKTI